MCDIGVSEKKPKCKTITVVIIIIIMRFEMWDSRLIREILYSQKDQGNQVHPNEENQRIILPNLIKSTKDQTDNQSCIVWMLRSVTHLASISSVPSTLTFVALRISER